MSDDDALVLIVDGQPMSVNLSAMESSSEMLMQWIASFKERNPGSVPIIKLSLPDLDLPPFFNRQNLIVNPREAFHRYYAFLIGWKSEPWETQFRLSKAETHDLASFVILSDYLLEKRMHYFLEWLLCFRFGRHLCESTLQFARRYSLRKLHRKSLAALIRDESYHTETSYNVSLEEITSLMTPGFFKQISVDPLTEMIKFVAKIDLPKQVIKSDICCRRCEIIVHDAERLEHFAKWFEIVTTGLHDHKQLRYGLTIIDCLRIEGKRQPLPRMLRALAVASNNARSP